jgi:hypothetical protein
VVSGYKIRGIIKMIRTLFIFLLIASCGRENSNEIGVEEQEDKISHYRAILSPLNSSESAKGAAIFDIEQSTMRVRVHMTKLSGPVTHPQLIYHAKECPKAFDLNQDGVIDSQELFPNVNASTIALDDDLSTTVSSRFPRSNSSGKYDYQKNLEMASLKVSRRQEMNLAGKVIVVYGTRKWVPPTAYIIPGFSLSESIPVACGKIISILKE